MAKSSSFVALSVLIAGTLGVFALANTKKSTSELDLLAQAGSPFFQSNSAPGYGQQVMQAAQARQGFSVPWNTYVVTSCIGQTKTTGPAIQDIPDVSFAIYRSSGKEMMDALQISTQGGTNFNSIWTGTQLLSIAFQVRYPGIASAPLNIDPGHFFIILAEQPGSGPPFYGRGMLFFSCSQGLIFQRDQTGQQTSGQPGSTPGATCNNGVCEAGEKNQCNFGDVRYPEGSPQCLKGTCPTDCGQKPPSGSCGDRICSTDEGNGNPQCVQDCGNIYGNTTGQGGVGTPCEDDSQCTPNANLHCDRQCFCNGNSCPCSGTCQPYQVQATDTTNVSCAGTPVTCQPGITAVCDKSGRTPIWVCPCGSNMTCPQGQRCAYTGAGRNSVGFICVPTLSQPTNNNPEDANFVSQKTCEPGSACGNGGTCRELFCASYCPNGRTNAECCGTKCIGGTQGGVDGLPAPRCGDGLCNGNESKCIVGGAQIEGNQGPRPAGCCASDCGTAYAPSATTNNTQGFTDVALCRSQTDCQAGYICRAMTTGENIGQNTCVDPQHSVCGNHVCEGPTEFLTCGPFNPPTCIERGCTADCPMNG